MKLKVCGMKYEDNILEIAALQPDYLGFIFYDKSKRNFKGEIPKIPDEIKKVGVFVNETIDIVIETIITYNLDVVQLHGEETTKYCKNLNKNILENRSIKDKIDIIKVFSIGEHFDFDILSAYENVCDYFLFDTKGKQKGGNGITFNWELLKNYPSQKPYFLSGGIGNNEIEKIKTFLQDDISNKCFALDVNSKFEIKAGLKSVNKLVEFKNSIF